MKILSKLDNTGMIDEVTDKKYVTDAEKIDITHSNRLVLDELSDVGGHLGYKGELQTGKKVARFIVGTSTVGWTSADCDYLCDGTDDNVEINAAIAALPATGGEIIILDGTYNLAAKIDVTKDNVSIRGNGDATIVKRMFDSDMPEGLITLIGRSGCKIANLQIEGNEIAFSDTNYNIYLEASSNNTVTGNTCNNSYYGIYLRSSSDNTVTDNTCNNTSCGIYLEVSSNNVVTGNTCNNNECGIFLEASSNDVVTGNTCNNNEYGIFLAVSSNNTVTGNTGNNNSYYGIYLEVSSNNAVTGNTCIRGTGLATDYTASQHTIQLTGTGNSYNLISNNNCMGKAPVIAGGTGNSVYGNKYDSGDYKDFTQDEKTKLAGIAASANNYAHPTTAGNKHIPTGGASGQILRYSASGTAIWGTDTDTVTTINGKTGAITKADIVALGIPAQDTVVDSKAIVDLVYPIGSIYIATSSTNPGTLFGHGTWAAFGTGRTLVGVDTAQTEFSTIEKTGGAKTHTLTASEMPAHTHTQNAHNHTFSSGSAASAGAHTHTVTGTVASGGAHTHSVTGTVASGGAHTHTVTGTVASAGAHTHHPHDSTVVNSAAYIAWYTANAGAGWYPQNAVGTDTRFPSKSAGAHTHTFSSGKAASAGAHGHTFSSGSAASAGGHSHTFSSGSAASKGAHTHTVSGSISNTTATNQNTGGGSAHTNLQPYITVYMWKRTA